MHPVSQRTPGAPKRPTARHVADRDVPFDVAKSIVEAESARRQRSRNRVRDDQSVVGARRLALEGKAARSRVEGSPFDRGQIPALSSDHGPGDL